MAIVKAGKLATRSALFVMHQLIEGRLTTFAGIVIAVSTAYRAWLDWRADVRLPMVALGSPDRAELAGFVKYLVSRIHNR